MREEPGIYSKEVMKHFLHPHNMGEIKNADGIGKVGNPICGDVMWLYIKIKKDKKTGKEIISDAKFKTFGCVAAISTSSIVTDLAKGKTLEEAIKIKDADVIKGLGGKLPAVKYHCSVLAADALYEAIYHYMTKNKIKVPEELENAHERIMENSRVAEERHKDYMKFEEDLLKRK